MTYAIIGTLNESKHKKKTSILMEYNISFNDTRYSFLVDANDIDQFEERFNQNKIESYNDFVNTFHNIELTLIKE